MLAKQAVALFHWPHCSTVHPLIAASLVLDESVRSWNAIVPTAAEIPPELFNGSSCEVEPPL